MLSSAGHAILYPLSSGRAGSLFVRAALESAAIAFLLFGMYRGIDKVWSFTACTHLCVSSVPQCCLPLTGFIIWLALATLGLGVWTLISCSLKSDKLVSTALVNSLLMIVLLSIWLYTRWDFWLFLLLELLIFMASYYGYLKAVRRRNSQKIFNR